MQITLFCVCRMGSVCKPTVTEFKIMRRFGEKTACSRLLLPVYCLCPACIVSCRIINLCTSPFIFSLSFCFFRLKPSTASKSGTRTRWAVSTKSWKNWKRKTANRERSSSGSKASWRPLKMRNLHCRINTPRSSKGCTRCSGIKVTRIVFYRHPRVNYASNPPPLPPPKKKKFKRWKLFWEVKFGWQ